MYCPRITLKGRRFSMKHVYLRTITILAVLCILATVTVAEPAAGPEGSQDRGLPGQRVNQQMTPGMNPQSTPNTGQAGGLQGMKGAAAQGPYLHNITSASSTDGLSFTPDKTILINHGSVPSAVLTSDGRILLYYVDASGAMKNIPETTAVAISKDNSTTFSPADLVIEGNPSDKALDPSVVVLPDGTFRLYYYASDRIPAGQTAAHEIRTAVSEDGITFTDEGVAFLWPGLVDPDVWWNGTIWQMYVYSIAEGDTVVATSNDGVNFTYQGPLGIGKVGTSTPFMLDDGSFRMFVFEQTGDGNIISFRSNDGYTWAKEAGVRLQKPGTDMVADPSIVRLSDGTWKLFYKVSPSVQAQGQNQGTMQPMGQIQQNQLMPAQKPLGNAGQQGMAGPGGQRPGTQ